MYADGAQKVDTIYDGLPIDNDTIYWDTTGSGSKVLKAKGGGGEAGSVQWANISGKPTWIGDTKPSYNWSEIQGEKPFYTKEEADKRYVTINTEQEITALKHFKKGLSIGEAKKLIYEENGILFIDANVAVTGALTVYATGPQSVGSIYDGLPIDNDTIYWQEVDGSRVLKAKEGSGASFDKATMWTALAGSTTEQINKSHLTAALTGYATESWVTGKNYAVKATTLAGYGITDAYTKLETDNKYLLKTSYTAADILAKLKTVDGHGSGVDADTLDGTEKSELFTAFSYSQSVLSTTIGGISKSVKITGSFPNISGVSMNTIASYGNSMGMANLTGTSTNVNPGGKTSWHHFINMSNTTEADNMWQSQIAIKAGTTEVWVRSRNGGTISDSAAWAAPWVRLARITDNVASATKLQTARTLWGRSFDGTGNVSGNLDSVGNITLNRNAIIKGGIGGSDYWRIYTKEIDASKSDFIIEVGDDMDKRILCRQTYWSEGRSPREITLMGYSGEQRFIDVYINGIRLHKTADGVITLEGNLAVTGGITTYAIDPVSASTVMDGVVVDGVTIKKENGKLVAVGGGEAGSVQWENISGKPSVFETNIANITDLHSSWDAVLKAQKPNWLTAVSIATISDLHANWDALLKAAPSAYVTRWPTISEVTGKQNLVVKLNGGTTEGTNQFTYNATGAKTINITPAGIGAATSGHTHTVIKNNLMLKGSNGISDSAGITLALGDSDTGFKWVSDGAVQIYANNIAIGQWNSSGMNWLKAPKVNGKKIWYEDNDGKGSGLDAGLLCGIDCTGFCRAFSASTDLGVGNITTTQFVDKLKSIGAFEHPYWMMKASWSYASNPVITDSGYGNIQLAGAVIEVMGYNNVYTIRITTAPAATNGIANAVFVYRNHGYDYSPNWKRMANTTDNVESATRLRDTQNIWGRPFNGTGPVSGALSGVGGINFPNGEKIDMYGNVILPTVKNNWNVFLTNTSNTLFRVDASGYVFSKGSYRSAAGSHLSNNLENISEPYSCRFMSEKVSDIPAGHINPFCGWSDSASSGWTTSYVIGSIRNYANNWGEMYFGIYQYEGASRNWKAYMALDGVNRHLYINGNLMVTGGGTFYGSDIRYKSIIQHIKLSLLDIAKAPSFVYHWNKKEMICDRLNIGGSAQYTKTILPWAVEEKNNLLTMDYATVAYTFAVHTARHLMNYETRTDKKIKKLENRVKYLEKQLKKLGYEEASIVDDQSI